MTTMPGFVTVADKTSLKTSALGINRAMQIRTYTSSDLNKVIDLWQTCNLVVPQNDPLKDIDRKMNVAPDLFLVGDLNGQIVASVMGGYEGHRGWINYLAVSPDHQRKGYGRQIMTAVEKRINEKGCPKINLQVRQTNKSIIAFYQAIGYQVDPVTSLGKRLVKD